VEKKKWRLLAFLKPADLTSGVGKSPLSLLKNETHSLISSSPPFTKVKFQAQLLMRGQSDKGISLFDWAARSSVAE
jgi:hypothetical protein